MTYAEMNPDQQMSLTREVMSLLFGWGLSGSEIVVILGLPEGSRARIVRRLGEDQALPVDDTVQTHVTHLMGIGDALRTTHPRSPQMRDRWMRQPCRQFRGKSPVQVMVEEELNGLLRVRRHLDCAFGWDETGS
ncbi:MAG: MbcA/ParS/Xre antitoxin family protein [Gammaproteobacteria bacterium]